MDSLTRPAAFIACIPLANWLIGHVGTVCPPNNPCLVPVAPGLMAPSGVLMIGLALVLRDLVQRRLGPAWSVNAVIAGAALSALLAPPELVIASAVAFLFSELADFAVYTPLQQRRFVLAVIASSAVGLVGGGGRGRHGGGHRRMAGQRGLDLVQARGHAGMLEVEGLQIKERLDARHGRAGHPRRK